MYLCKCINCGKLLSENDKVVQIRRVTGFDKTDILWTPTCSNECAIEANMRNINKLNDLMSLVLNQEFKSMTAKEFINQ